MAYKMDIEIYPPPPSPVMNTELVVKNVWSGKNWWSSIRKNYQRAVCVEWQDGDTTIEPVSNLIDYANREVCEKLIPILNNWRISVEKGVCFTKKCAFCNGTPRMADDFRCKYCKNETKWLNLFINNDQILRENRSISKMETTPPHPLLLPIPKKLILKRKFTELEENLKQLNFLVMDIAL